MEIIVRDSLEVRRIANLEREIRHRVILLKRLIDRFKKNEITIFEFNKQITHLGKVL